MTYVYTYRETGDFSTEALLKQLVSASKKVSSAVFNADGTASLKVTSNGETLTLKFAGDNAIKDIDDDFYHIEIRNAGGEVVLTISTEDTSLGDFGDARNVASLNDLLFGEDDSFYGDSGDDNIVGYEGDDYLSGYRGNDFLDGWLDNDFISGGSGHDTVYGGGGNDDLYGDTGNDFLSGGVGNDTISGGSGRDTLQGNKGADKLFGGSGADTFAFKFTSDSTTKATSRDTILDFSSGSDRIDLKLMDANSKVSGNQTFKFIGDDGFHRKAGELRFTQNDTTTFIDADVNGDGKTDFSVAIQGVIDLVKGDFIL